MNVFKKKWNLVDKKRTIKDVYDTNRDFLEMQYRELNDELDQSTKTKFSRFIEHQNSKKDGEKIQKQIQNELEWMAYNERDVVMKNKKCSVPYVAAAKSGELQKVTKEIKEVKEVALAHESDDELVD